MSKDWIAEIDDYTNGVTTEPEAFEDELFAAAAGGQLVEAVFLDRVSRIAPAFAARGGFAGGATKEQIAALRKQPRVHYIELEEGRVIDIPPWAPDTELVTYRYVVDLREHHDITVTMTTLAGEHVWTFHDSQQDPGDGNLYGFCDEPFARSTFRERPLTARIEGKRGDQNETVATFELRPIG